MNDQAEFRGEGVDGWGYPGPASAGTTGVVIDSVEYRPFDGALPPHQPALPLLKQ